MVIKTRARSQSAKIDRRNQLLAVARELFEARGLAFSMLEVANAANLAKGTTYLYFATKEELLLELLAQELEGWFLELHTILEPSFTSQNLAIRIASSISSRQTLVGLFAVQVSVLEQNLSYQAALKFKTFLLEQSLQIIPKLERIFPSANGLEVLQLLNALVIGLAQMSRPVGTMQLVLQRPEIQAMHVSFALALEHSLITLFKGLGEKS